MIRHKKRFSSVDVVEYQKEALEAAVGVMLAEQQYSETLVEYYKNPKNKGVNPYITKSKSARAFLKQDKQNWKKVQRALVPLGQILLSNVKAKINGR